MDILGLLKELFSGVLYLFTAEGLKTLVMFVISGVLIYLAIKKDYEPALLLPIGFGAILANLPPVIDQVTGSATASVLGSEGFLTVLFNAGIKKRFHFFNKPCLHHFVHTCIDSRIHHFPWQR